MKVVVKRENLETSMLLLANMLSNRAFTSNNKKVSKAYLEAASEIQAELATYKHHKEHHTDTVVYQSCQYCK